MKPNRLTRLALCLVILLTLCAPAQATMGYLLGTPKVQFFDNNGAPLVGGKLYTYKVGTSTPKATYNNPDLAPSHANTNPIILDARGEATVWLSGATQLVLKNANDVLIYTFPSVGSPLSSVDISVKDYGAIGDGTTDDTTALNAAVAACPTGGVIHLPPGTYKTTGWLISKDISIISDSGRAFGTGATGAVLKAAGAQAYILKLQGAYGAGDGLTFIHSKLQNITFDGNNKVISDAALVMEYSLLSTIDGCNFINASGHGFRGRTLWSFRMNEPYIYNCGTLDTGSAFYLDGPTPLDYSRICSDVAIRNGTWSANKGRWLEVSSLAGADIFWFEGNKLELDDLTILNTVNTNVLQFGALSRGMILNNSFSSFGTTLGKYANLIWIGGINDDLNNGAPGNCSNVVRGNKAFSQAGSGNITGLYLAANAPTCVEEDNDHVFNGNTVTCGNTNASTFPQLINRAWRSFSSSRYPLALPDGEHPGFLSIHKVARGFFAETFTPDANATNNSQTVLQEGTASQVSPKICKQLDLSRWVGHAATNLIIKVRMRLDAAGSVTVALNPIYPSFAGSYSVVDSQNWTWYEFLCPIASLTTTNHFLDAYLWAINTGTPKLLVDGFEFSTSDDLSETVTTGSPALIVGGLSNLNSSGGAITGSLANGVYVGQMKTIVMTDATTSSTVSVTTHVTSNPEVFTFAVQGATLVLRWNGTAWATIHNYGVTT